MDVSPAGRTRTDDTPLRHEPDLNRLPPDRQSGAHATCASTACGRIRWGRSEPGASPKERRQRCQPPPWILSPASAHEQGCLGLARRTVPGCFPPTYTRYSHARHERGTSPVRLEEDSPPPQMAPGQRTLTVSGPTKGGSRCQEDSVAKVLRWALALLLGSFGVSTLSSRALVLNLRW